MRILFIANDFPNPLEPTKAVFNLHLARGLARHHDVRVISPVSWLEQWHAGRRGAILPPGRKTVMDGIAVYYPKYVYPPGIMRNQYGWFYWHSIRKTVRDVIRDQRPDAVLAYWAHPDGHAAVMAARMAGVPSAVIVGGSDIQIITKNPSRRRRVLEVLQNIDAVVAVNHDLKTKTQAMGIPPEKVHAWSQGVDEKMFFPGDRAQARTLLGLPATEHHLLWVGRFVPVKGVEILVQACEILHQRGMDFRMHLVGEGPLRSQLENDCSQRGLREKVIFHGPRSPEKLGDFYRAADLFLTSSWSEGLPNVLREALACGTPFVSSRVGGIAEIAGDFNKLFPAGDAPAMADQITAMLAEKHAVPDSLRPVSWEHSGENLVQILGNCKPRPVTTDQPARWTPRQVLRRAMGAVLPRNLLLVHGPQRCDSVCLTFDDGPHPSLTPRVLDVLAEQGVKATFFVVGNEAVKHAELVRRMAREGHTVAHHTFTHKRPEDISAAQLINEIHRTSDVLSQAAAKPARLFRPPWGKISLAKLWALWRQKLTVVLWNRDPKDFSGKSAQELRQWLAQRPLRGGDLVLLHDTISATAEVLPELICAARAAGLRFTTVDHWTGHS